MAKYDITVSTSVVNIFDNDVPPTFTEVIPKAVILNEDISQELVLGYSKNFAGKMARAYDYGLNEYTYGLPDGTRQDTDHSANTVKVYLEGQTAKTLNIVSCEVSECQPRFFAYNHLIQERGFDPFDSTVTNPPFTKPETTTWFSGARLDSDNQTLHLYYTVDGYYIHPENLLTDLNPYRETVDLGQTLDRDDRYYHVIYEPADEPGNYTAWTYQPSTGVISELTLTDTDTLVSQFLPIVPLRKDKKNMGREEVQDTELYKTSRKLVNIMGLNFDDLTESIKQSPVEQEAEGGEIKYGVNQINLMCGINVDTSRQISQQYLYDFFAQRMSEDSYSHSHFLSRIGSNNEPSLNVVTIKDGSYQSQLKYHYITEETITGSVAELGEVKRTINKNVDAAVTETYTGTDENGDPETTTRTLFNYNNSTLVLEYQQTINEYSRITVHGPRFINHGMDGHTSVTYLNNLNNDGNNGFIIPLSYVIAEQYPTDVQSRLYRESIKLVFTAYTKDEVLWYETDFFKFFLAVGAFALAVWSAGQSLALLAAVYAQYGILGVIVLAGIYYGVSWTMERIVTLYGEKWGLAVAVIAIIASAYFSYMDMGVPAGVDGAPMAEVMLVFASNMIPAAFQAQIQEGIQELQNEITKQQEILDKELDALKEINDELNMMRPINPYAFIGREPILAPGETPEQFYARTIHSGNIGVASIDAIHEYVDIKLTLPEPNFTA